MTDSAYREPGFWYSLGALLLLGYVVGMAIYVTRRQQRRERREMRRAAMEWEAKGK